MNELSFVAKPSTGSDNPFVKVRSKSVFRLSLVLEKIANDVVLLFPWKSRALNIWKQLLIIVPTNNPFPMALVKNRPGRHNFRFAREQSTIL